MSDLLALIRACKDEPDDDAPRLVLADWLEEHGDEERGAFIRRQLQSKSSDEVPYNPEWLGEWKRWGDEHKAETSGYPVAFERGFLHVRDGYRELYNTLDQILNPPYDWSWIEALKFGSWHNGDWSPLFQYPRLLELNSLTFIDDHYRSNLFRPLSNCPYLSNLKHLCLAYINGADDGLRRLSDGKVLRNLRSLVIGVSKVGRRGANAFAQSDVWDSLQRCSFRCNGFGDPALAELAKGRIKPRLQSLDITHGRYTDQGLVQFARTDRYPSLRELAIGYSEWNEEDAHVFGRFGIESLLQSTSLRLERLLIYICGPETVPDEIEELARNNVDRISLSLRSRPSVLGS